MPLAFSPATKKDAEGLCALLSAAAHTLCKKGVMQWTSPFVPSDIAQDIQNGPVLLAFWDETLAGAVFLENMTENRWPCPVVQTGQFYLHHLVVHPDFQGKGIGQAIIAESKQTAKAAGKALFLDCWAGNEKLEKFYKSAGFCELGVFDEEDYQIRLFHWQP